MPLVSIPADEYLRLSNKSQVRCYRSHFSDRMEMLAPPKNVAAYLDHHQGWFQRCAAPMEVKALDDQSYLLTLGQFELLHDVGIKESRANLGSFGIEKD